MRKALVLLSGGQDSTTCLYWAKNKFDYVEAIGFDYGQRHGSELEFAKKTALISNINFEIISINNIFKNSALINKSEDLNAVHPNNKNLPSSFVPGRNILFISLASSYAYNKKIDNIVTGVCETDYSGYPDCRKEFIDCFEKMVNKSTKQGLTGEKFKIHTPLINLTKKEIIVLGSKNGVDFSKTSSCYNPELKKLSILLSCDIGFDVLANYTV